MKTEIKIHEPEVKDFPALYRHEDGTVLFLYNRKKGVCLVAGGNTPVGSYAEAWDVDLFTKITSDATITFKAGA